MQAFFKGPTCRDEVKKLNREKTQLTDRLKEAESAQLRLDTEVSSLRSSAATSTERHDAVFADTERKLHQAQELARTKQEEASKSLVTSLLYLLSAYRQSLPAV